jgi:hypothetical protein
MTKKKIENNSTSLEENVEINGQKITKETCGIIMPISSIDGCSAEHWGDVLNILTDIIKNSGLEANIVSDSDDVGVIQKRIIQNIYNNPIVVCDVSGKNPNVMFELGMRLAFDKPTIIIKDDKTDYSFDTSVIEHLTYPRDLRFTKITAFKEKLKEKIKATLEKSKSDSNYTTFLKHFGDYKVASLETREISSQDFILESINDLKKDFRMFRRTKNEHPELRDSKVHILRGLIEQFKDENLIDSNTELIESRKELENFLESHQIVKDACGNRRTFSDTLDEMLPPF